MKYTTVNPDAVADEVIAAKHAEAKTEAANLALAYDSVEFCRTLLAIDDKPADPKLDEQATQITDQKVAKASEIRRLVGKLATVPDTNQQRREWLIGYMEQIEREHAAHAALEALATEDGNAEQAKAHAVAQLEIEGAHVAASAELAVLAAEPKPAPTDPPAPGKKKP